MEKIRVIYHEEDGSWWTESPDFPGWVSGADTYEEARKLAEDGIPWALEREVELEHDPAERLERVEVDGEPAPFPAGDPPAPSDLLSDELEQFGRDTVYEDAVRAAVP